MGGNLKQVELESFLRVSHVFITQTTLSIFLVGRNRSTRRKPIIFDKALTNSFQYDTLCFELFYRLDKTNAQMAKFEVFVAYNEAT